MAANKGVWGIDLGQCALKAIRLRAAGDKVEALDHVHIEHGRILSQPEVDRPALIAESMKKFLDQHDLSKEILVVGVPGQHTLARFTKLPPVDKKKIPEIVKYEAQQQIPFDMEEVIWDYQNFEDPDGMETEVGIFAMRRELMREHLRFLSDLNLEPGLVQSAPLALYNALFYDGLCGSEPVAILDIGAQNTDLLVVDGNSLWTRNIPIGGNHFTETLLKTFKLSFSKAENLKRSAGSSKYARQVFQAMRPVFADLVAEIQRSIGFFTSSHRGVKLSKLIAMGNAFKLPGMPKFIQQNLGMEVVRPTTFHRLSTSEASNAPQLMDHLLSYGVAYGLALQGLGLSQITSNLLPPEIAKQVIWRKKTPWFYGAAACLALSAALIWGRNLSDQRALASAIGGDEANPPPPPVDVESAARIIENGPADPDLPPKFYAKQIVAAGQVLENEQTKVGDENEGLLVKAQEIEKLQSDKVIWPRILDMIHSALPSPEPEELASALAKGPQAYKDLVGSDEKYERRKRKQIWIQKLNAEFSLDVMATYEDVRQGGRSRDRSRQRPPAESDSAPLKKGFVITLIGQTPFAGGDRGRGLATDFLTKTLVAKLEKTEKEVYFDNIRLTRCSLVGQSGSAGGWTSSTSRTKSTRRPTRSTRVFSAGRGPDTIARPTEGNDPVTGESTLKDWEFEIVFVAVLGKRPQADGSGGED